MITVNKISKQLATKKSVKLIKRFVFKTCTTKKILLTDLRGRGGGVCFKKRIT